MSRKLRTIFFHVPELKDVQQNINCEENIIFDISSQENTLPDIVVSAFDEDIDYAVRNNIACIYVNTCDGHSVTSSNHAKYILEDIEGLDADYINEVYSRHNNLPLTIGRTRRLVIRELTCNDIEILYNAAQEEHLSINNGGFEISLEEALSLHKQYITHQYGFYGFGFWGMFLPDSDILVGRCGFELKNICDALCNEAECGYYVLPEFRNLGYAGEALDFVLDMAHTKFEIDTLYIVTECTNTLSVNLAKKHGFCLYKSEVILRNSKDCFILENHFTR